MKPKSLLLDGNIPVNTSCPFLDVCSFKKDSCPGVSAIKTVEYSCAAARLWDSIKSEEEVSRNT